MNNKGFTLVELLATLTILSIIMAIAIPTTLSTLDKNKKNTYVSDAKRMATMAELEYKKNGCLKGTVTGSGCKLSLNVINDGTLSSDPDNGDYNKSNSFVIVNEVYSGGYYSYDYKIYLEGTRKVGKSDSPVSVNTVSNSDVSK